MKKIEGEILSLNMESIRHFTLFAPTLKKIREISHGIKERDGTSVSVVRKPEVVVYGWSRKADYNVLFVSSQPPSLDLACPKSNFSSSLLRQGEVDILLISGEGGKPVIAYRD